MPPAFILAFGAWIRARTAASDCGAIIGGIAGARPPEAFWPWQAEQPRDSNICLPAIAGLNATPAVLVLRRVPFGPGANWPDAASTVSEGPLEAAGALAAGVPRAS